MWRVKGAFLSGLVFAGASCAVLGSCVVPLVVCAKLHGSNDSASSDRKSFLKQIACASHLTGA